MDVNAQIEQVASMLKQTLVEDIEIALQLEKSLPPVKIDPAHLEQILINLAVNCAPRHASRGTLSFERNMSRRQTEVRRTAPACRGHRYRQRFGHGEVRCGLGKSLRAVLHDEANLRRHRLGTPQRSLDSFSRTMAVSS